MKVSRKTKNCKALMACAALALSLGAQDAYSAGPKYVFFFLGDGMSNSQIQATEAYLTTKNGDSATLATDLLKPENRLNMSKMPVQGMQTTYDSFALMTDSASSATAFACGLKTKSGVIGMGMNGNDPVTSTPTIPYKSIAQVAHEAGKKVGVISSVSLDHATPAAYYASIASRSNYNAIATQMADTGYEFFGGGGLVAGNYDTITEAQGLLNPKGYQILNTRDSILALKETPQDKVVCINSELDGSKAMPYAIDRNETTNLSLAEMTDVAISTLSAGADKGFFLMVEGGKIDWAGHANDAMANIGDMLDFDDAVGEALKFYAQYPNDTLIIVTGDHETGGMTIGHATNGYTAHYGELLKQKHSFEFFDKLWAQHETTNQAAVCGNIGADSSLANDATVIGWMNDLFGLDYNTPNALNAYQKKKLEDAYDYSMCETNNNSAPENTFLYGGYNAISVTMTHILNEKASIGWTSYSHTGVPVPVFAKGRVAQSFAGFYDNTDIAKRMAKVMGLPALPVQK